MLLSFILGVCFWLTCAGLVAYDSKFKNSGMCSGSSWQLNLAFICLLLGGVCFIVAGVLWLAGLIAGFLGLS